MDDNASKQALQLFNESKHFFSVNSLAIGNGTVSSLNFHNFASLGTEVT